ncbi:phage tail sheath family protein [Paenibacillus alvei]|uniref:Phage tail sheath family protein n=1 Tax=Paenibacillus alvei TaxID=44250 RepID=A0ABT4GX07_PAEAL|nr:phage tail sheath subtilisin-like domain-containing protein [Paenibacillus alvei]MCY9734631.1 phage tail sheath family protein [Paenibacillus alvei]MCY9755351.1 phage tail sheath family protein [Paenibacillus alvei]MCY9761243.1 phage tail sheath family protein [Paenibacillus alvei]MCY9765712.1 phage tail sheath family protein [Paenibacillus alvei]
MSIQRTRPGAYVELHALAKARVLSNTGRVLVPYQAEWGQPNQAVDMADDSERLLETGKLVDVVELAAEKGATVIGYRVTNGDEKAAAVTVADSYTIEARYPGTRGNDFEYMIRPALVDPTKKEIVIRDTKGVYDTETYIVVDKADTAVKLKKSAMVRFIDIGAVDMADVVFTKMTGGKTGTAPINASDWSRIFNRVDGLTFDVFYLPATDPAVQAAAKQWLLDRRTKARKLAQLVVAGDPTKDDDIEAHNERSRAMNARYLINCSIAGKHINGKTYSSVEWAAWVAGLVAGTPANQSFTGVKVPMTLANVDWSHSEVLKGLSEGTLMATRDGYDYVVESAVNTLSTLAPGEREDFGKIRVSMTIDQILNDIYSTGKKYRAQLDNDRDGRATFIAAVVEYLKIRAQQKAIAEGFVFEEHPTKKSEFDYAYFSLLAKPLDAIEAFYIDWEVA